MLMLVVDVATKRSSRILVLWRQPCIVSNLFQVFGSANQGYRNGNQDAVPGEQDLTSYRYFNFETWQRECY
jgi:hypothetical protein